MALLGTDSPITNADRPLGRTHIRGGTVIEHKRAATRKV